MRSVLSPLQDKADVRLVFVREEVRHRCCACLLQQELRICLLDLPSPCSFLKTSSIESY